MKFFAVVCRCLLTDDDSKIVLKLHEIVIYSWHVIAVFTVCSSKELEYKQLELLQFFFIYLFVFPSFNYKSLYRQCKLYTNTNSHISKPFFFLIFSFYLSRTYACICSSCIQNFTLVFLVPLFCVVRLLFLLILYYIAWF